MNQGKRYLLTGASSGIGAALARELASKGYDLALAARREDNLHLLAAELQARFGRKAVVLPLDVTDYPACQDAVGLAANALGGYQSINDLVLPNGRLLEQRNRTWELLNDIPGISCVKPMGALYAFPKIDPKVCPIHNDEKFVLDLLLSEKLLIVQGTAFNWPWPDHFRVVTLPRVDDLEQAIGRIGSFLKGYQQ